MEIVYFKVKYITNWLKFNNIVSSKIIELKLNTAKYSFDSLIENVYTYIIFWYSLFKTFDSDFTVSNYTLWIQRNWNMNYADKNIR